MLKAGRIILWLCLGLLSIGLCIHSCSKQPVFSCSGYVCKMHQWNNYGRTVAFYKNTVELARTQTSINGYFGFSLPPGLYDMYVYDGALLAATQTVRVPGVIRIHLPNTQQPFYPVETIGFFIALLILVLGIIAVVQQQKIQSIFFFGMAFSFALVNGIEWLQSFMALSNEVSAGSIFSLKHIGIVWFGIFLLFFVFSVVRRHVLFWLICLGILETIFLLSWLWLGSDPAFVTAWGFSYGLLRDICVVQTFLAVIAAYVFSLRTEHRVLMRAGLLWFLVLFFVLVVFPVLIQHGTEFFALQYNLAASVGGLILFLSLFSVLMTYRVRGVEQFMAGSVMYSVMSIVLIGIYAVLVVAFGRFVQYAKNDLLSLYAVLIAVMAILPFKDVLQKYLEQKLLGDTSRYREAISVLTERLETAVFFKDVQTVVHQVFKTYFAVSAKIIRAVGDTDIVFSLHTEEPVTLVIAPTAGRIFAQAEIAAFEKACSTISLAMNRVIAYEKQLRALAEIEQQARLASLGTLTAGLAHEIKNPLAVLQNIISVLPLASAKKLKTEYIPLLQRQIERMQGLLHNMLQFARPENLAFKKIYLKAVVEKTLMLIAATARARSVSVHADLSDLLIRGDERSLEQVLLNICMNALESMPQGGTLRIVLKKGVLTIADTGSGMSEATQRRIFDPFFTTKTAGTGLGLSISKRILEKHRATVTVQSELKKGTAFVLRFKRAQ